MPIHDKDFTPNERGPLAGVRVLDLSRLVSGNTLTMLLADMGAEVVKVEAPAGDNLRAWVKGGVSTDWKSLGRNKKSLGVDLRRPEGMELLRRLLREAAVLVENFRPGTLEKMGLAPEALWAENPRLVIARVSGWGQTGPYARRPGFGTLIEGMCGMAAATGFPDGPPILPPLPLADSCAGYCGAFSVLAALREVEVNGGRGQVIDQSLFAPLFAAMGAQPLNYKLTGQVKPRQSNNNLYATNDGKYVTMTASMEPMPQRMLEAIGKGAYNNDPDYAGVAGRQKHGPEIRGWIQEFMGRMSQEEAVAFFEAREVTVAPVYDVSQIIEDPHFQETETVVNLADEEVGRAPMFGFLNQLSGTPPRFFRPAPGIGEHNRDVLSWLDLPEDEVAALEQGGVLHTGKAGKNAKRKDFSYQG